MLVARSGCNLRRVGLLKIARATPSQLLPRANYGQLPMVTSVASRTKHTATPPPPPSSPSSSQPATSSPHRTESQLSIYEGPFSQTARRLKLFSVSSLAATIALCPFIFILDAGISSGMRGGLAVAAVATSGSSTALVQWCLGSYVRKITIPNPLATSPSPSPPTPSSSDLDAVTITRSTPVSFETLSFLGGRRITTVKVSDLEPSSAPFSTIRIREGQGSVVRDGRGRVLSDDNKLKKRFYLHGELTEEEPMRTIMAEIQQNQNLTGVVGRVGVAEAVVDVAAQVAKKNKDKEANDVSAGAEGQVKAPVTEGMSDRIEQLKRKASENAKKGQQP
ncbi:hypothetical protein BG011_002930 [Mortierella polycephala]|uniref:Transmembrane protein n=1 Tax=Mortierella polycephala TaxID=41804 RepID=A0A9P6U9B6_9FUNG|nr:hypothetical protein BG011_002930 [Mortierella polycephala]